MPPRLITVVIVPDLRSLPSFGQNTCWALPSPAKRVLVPGYSFQLVPRFARPPRDAIGVRVSTAIPNAGFPDEK